eukprot:7479473-Pyramimonas_sp.AAC.2
MPLVFLTLSSRFRGSRASTLDRYLPSDGPLTEAPLPPLRSGGSRRHSSWRSARTSRCAG